MKRAGFTMIELIFVIVILGILAAVAIPKLAATRDDAKLASELTSVAQTVQNAGAEYTAKGTFDNTYKDTSCYQFTHTTDGNFTITEHVNTAAGGTTTLCDKVWVKGRQQDLNGTKEFGGSQVVW